MLRRCAKQVAAAVGTPWTARTFSASSAHATTVLCVRKGDEVRVRARQPDRPLNTPHEPTQSRVRLGF